MITRDVAGASGASGIVGNWRQFGPLQGRGPGEFPETDSITDRPVTSPECVMDGADI
jgi:hypothetical protein